MGKNNKIACIHITRNDVRIVEGRISSGVILISHSAIVQKADRFFSGDRLTNMSDLVSAIVNTMTMNSITAKELYIVYDNNLQVDFFLDEKLIAKKENKSFSFGKKKDANPGDAASAKNVGVIEHKKEWGKFITETEKGQLYTTTKIERDLVDFLISEFQEHGYKVCSLEAPETALLYLRKMIPFTYDALNKLVLYANDETTGYFYQFTKDAPSGGQKQVHFDASESNEFVGKVCGVIKDEIQKSALHNPHIMLVGDAFANPDTYIECCRALQEEGLTCVDLYARWKNMNLPINCIRVIVPDEDIEIERDGRFGICMALFARVFEGKPENLIEGFHLMGLNKKTKIGLVEVGLTVVSLFLVFSVITTGISVYENIVAKSEYERASNATESRLALAQQQRDAAKARVDSLSTIDRRYNEIFKFVYAQVDEDLNIASIDTMDMIPLTETTGSAYGGETTDSSQAVSDPSQVTQPTDGEQAPDVVDVTGETSVTSYTMQTIVIRGYSRTTDGPVELYKALVNADIGEVKVVGVEQVPLPSKETLFAFELTVGASEGGGV